VPSVVPVPPVLPVLVVVVVTPFMLLEELLEVVHAPQSTEGSGRVPAPAVIMSICVSLRKFVADALPPRAGNAMRAQSKVFTYTLFLLYFHGELSKPVQHTARLCATGVLHVQSPPPTDSVDVTDGTHPSPMGRGGRGRTSPGA
jgi:hypothetical protein